jgi:hypothetical protein
MAPATVNAENVVHELAHTWGVNYLVHPPDNIGHCSHNATGGTLACTMNAASNRGDGNVGFHWATDADSEYITMRRKSEPLPAP